MATDGADFQRRRVFHGKYYVEIKNGADATRLAEVSVEGLAREIRQDFPMPMLQPMVERIISCLSENSLFASNTTMLAQELNAQLSSIAHQYSEFGATRDVRELLIRSALETRAAGGVSHAEYRNVLLTDFGQKLLQLKSLDFAQSYTAKHQDMDETGVLALEGSIHNFAAGDLALLMNSICENPRGIPSSRWRGKTKSSFAHTVEALSNEVLAPKE